MRAIVLLSGGMDSTTVLAMAKQECQEVLAMAFDYGSKHAPWEIRAAREVAKHYEVGIHVVDLRNVFQHSHLLAKGPALPEGHSQDEVMRQTVVPGRNATLLSIAADYALGCSVEAVYFGCHGGDHYIYPDCRPIFMTHMNAVVYEMSEGKVHIRTPFLHDDKTRIIKWGLMNGVPYHLTRTCYTDMRVACGRCGSCQERLEAFAANDIDDPLEYASRILIPKAVASA